MARTQENDVEKGNGGSKADATPFQATAVPPLVVLLNPLIWILWIFDFAIWLITIVLPILSIVFCCRRCCGKQYSALADDDGDDEEASTCRRRSAKRWADGLIEEYEHMNADETEDEQVSTATAHGITTAAFEKYEAQDCFGTRTLLRVDKQKAMPRKVFGETTWQTYGQVGERVQSFGKGLRELGLAPLPFGLDLQASNGPHTFLIFEDTSAPWMTAMLGAFSQSIVVATSYATLGISAVGDAVEECCVRVLLCNRKSVPELIKIAPSCLQFIIYTDHNLTPEEIKAPPPGGNGRVRVSSFEAIVELGARSAAALSPPVPRSLAVIMYTSGSTGKPKGVMITHSNLAATMAALSNSVPVKPGAESYVAYLPAAHIFELCAEMSMIALGSKIGFADPRTLTSSGAVRQRDDGTEHEEDGYPDPPGALQEFQPTFMVAVPIVWDIFKKKAEEKVGGGPCIVKHLFMAAYSAQYLARKLGTTSTLLRFLILRKVAALMGGRMNIAITGGGPISSEVQTFISVAFGFPLVQGYGLTESTCAGAAQTIDDIDTGVLGGPVGSVEIKLRSCDGAEDPTDKSGDKYLTTDDEHLGKPCKGRGEICVRGPSLSMGYFKQPDVTRKAFMTDGWFRTGDIGMWDARGRLVIVDRLKNLVKLKGGEYIAIENMEKEYATSPYVQGTNGGIMCYGDGGMRRPVALVQVNMTQLEKWARSANIAVGDLDALCRHPEAQKVVLKNLQDSVKGRVADNEKLVAVRLISGRGSPDEASPMSPWSPENLCLTPSRKLNRQTIKQVWAAEIAELQAAGA